MAKYVFKYTLIIMIAVMMYGNLIPNLISMKCDWCVLLGIALIPLSLIPLYYVMRGDVRKLFKGSSK